MLLQLSSLPYIGQNFSSMYRSTFNQYHMQSPHRLNFKIFMLVYTDAGADLGQVK